MKTRNLGISAAVVVTLIVAGVAAALSQPVGQEFWAMLQTRITTLFATTATDDHTDHDDHDDHAEEEQHDEVTLSPQARKNLGLESATLQPTSYWRTVVIPGEVRDRPGISDRGVTAPVEGVVIAIHAYPGDTVSVGQPLFTLRLFSESLRNTQAELFKATCEAEFLTGQLERLKDVAKSGAIPELRLFELNHELHRQQAMIAVSQQDLLTRGLTLQQVQDVVEGRFASTVDVLAPAIVEAPLGLRTTDAPLQLTSAHDADSADRDAADHDGADPDAADQGSVLHAVDSALDHPAIAEHSVAEPAFEVQELAVELGQQVQAGQILARLSNHQSLYVVGQAFKRDAAALEQAARERRLIDIEFMDDDPAQWPEWGQTFSIRHLANMLDPDSRTFEFFIPLENQARTYVRNNTTFLVWRFRPGQRVRLHVPIEQFQNMFVLPAAAVVREGPEAYIFVDHGDHLDRLPVHLIHEDRRHAVIANDGSVRVGARVAQSAAASLNRVLKAQQAGGESGGHHDHDHDH